MGFGSDTLRQGSPQAIGATFFNKTIDNSSRFEDGDNAHLTRTSTSASTSNKQFTFSCWFKIGNLSGAYRTLLGTAEGGDREYIGLMDTDYFIYQVNNGTNLISNQKFRDTSAWYHVVVSVNINESVSQNRQKIYINGEQLTSFSSANYYGSSDTVNFMKSGVETRVGNLSSSYNNPWDGYMAEIHFVDGSSLGPEYFGENKNGVWIPKQVSGVTYGTNGFHLDFSDSSDLGKNVATGNTFASLTSSGLASTDQVFDSPTSNFNVNNPLDPLVSDRGVTLSQGNLRVQGGSGNYNASPTFDKVPGSYYAEFYVEEADNNTQTAVFARFSLLGGEAFNYRYNSDNELKKDGTLVATPGAFSDGDIIGVAASTVNNYVEFFKNGVSVYANTHTAAFESVSLTIRLDNTTTPKFICNYGQDASFAGNVTGANGYSVTAGGEFKYQPPRGFRAVKASNLTEPVLNPRNDSIENSFFYTTLYEGNGGGQRVGQFLPLNEIKTVNNAIRFEDGDTPYITRTPGSAGDLRKATYSFWFKRGNIGSTQGVYTIRDIGTTPGDAFKIYFNSTDTLAFQNMSGSSNDWNWTTTRVFKDTSKWYHVVIGVDSDQATDSDKIKLEINGETITSFGTQTYPSTNADQDFGRAYKTWIGVNWTDAGALAHYFDGYLADFHFVHGQKLDASYFGQTDPSTERWIPKTFTGNHGQNGFHLEFENPDLRPGLGGIGDSSANNNHFTPVNLGTANTVIDTPTKNFAVLDNSYGVIGASTLSEGNLKSDGAGFSSTLWGGGFASIPLPSTGKYYFECQDTATTGGSWGAGVCSEQATPSSTNTGGAESITFYNRSVMLNGTENDYGSSAGFGGLGDATYAAGDIMGVAVDCSTREVWFSQNGTFIDTPTTDNTGTPGNPSAGTYPVGTVDLNDSEPMRFVLFGSASNMICNFGQDSSFAGQIAASANTDGSGGQFKFTPPTGFKALNVDNLPQRSQGIARRKTPVFTWIKNRDSTDSHMLFDQVRGATKVLHTDPDAVPAETTEVNTLQKFLPGGFQIGNDVQVNTAGESYVAWNWAMHDDIVNAGPVTNTDGNNINSTVLADKKLGFSIVKYTGTGLGADTVGHGLSQKPDMIISGNINMDGATDYWYVNHKDLTASDYNIFLNLTSAESDVNTNYAEGGIGLGNSSVFDFIAGYSGSNNVANCNKVGSSYISYVFHSVEGFSAFGKYTGDGNADGPYITCGFKPSWIMIKNLNLAGTNWIIFDNKRSVFNITNDALLASGNNTEFVDNSSFAIDMVSNGFKIRSTYGDVNQSTNTLIYMACAEQPFMFANAR